MWLKNKHVCLTVLEAGSPRSHCEQTRCLVRTHFLVCRRPPSSSVLTWWRESSGLFIPLLGHHSYRGSSTLITSSKPNSFPKTPPPDTITLGFGLEHSGFGGDANIQSMAFPLHPLLLPHSPSTFFLPGCRLRHHTLRRPGSCLLQHTLRRDRW